MNYEEALNELKYDNEERDWDNCMFDMAGGVYEKCIEALEKQIPKKGRVGWANYCECPSCEWIIETEEPFNFCFNCGQRIDFSEV